MNELEMPDWLSQRVAITPTATALIFSQSNDGLEHWTFAQLQHHVLQLAGQMQPDIEAGQPVALLLNNGPHFVVAVHALMQLEAVIVPLNIRLTIDELEWQLQDVEAHLLISEKHFADRLQKIKLNNPTLKIFETAAYQNQARAEPVIVEPRQTLNLTDLHSIIYSSGTTGRPKGVMLTYGNHWWSAIGSSLNLGLLPNDKWLAVLPLFHVGGLSLLFKSVIYGMPIVLHNSFEAAAVNRAIDEQGVTIVSVVSTMLQRMLDERGERPYPANLRCLLLGGGPSPQPLLERCAALGAPVVQSYGLTEATSQVATLAPTEALTRLGSAGKPLFPTQIKIEAAATDGEGIGEILVRGPVVTKGYWNRSDETAQALRNGWLHTGDLGRIDPNGYLYVVDRRSDLIISGGENIYPAEIEATLLAHPAIEEAGVFGLPDVQWGQSVAAVVKLRPGQEVTTQAIHDFCATRLARYKIPTRMFFGPPGQNLPRNAAGKLLRRELRQQYA